MKIRHGFVSNSSSSNFIIAFASAKPKTVKALQKLMFGDEQTFSYDTYRNDKLSSFGTNKIAKAVFEQMKKAAKFDDVIQEIMYGIHDWNDHRKPKWKSEYEVKIPDPENTGVNAPYINNPKYDKNARDRYDAEIERYEKMVEEENKITALESFTKWNIPDDPVFYIVEFGDENGEFEDVCEHGGIFENVPHIQISHH